MGISQEMNKTAEDEKSLKRALTDMENELRDLNYTAANIRLHHLPSGFAGTDLDPCRLHSKPPSTKSA